MIKSEKVKEVLDIIEKADLSLEERIVVGKTMFNINGKNRIFNFLYREDIMIDRFNLTRPDNYNVTGFDTVEYELKSKSVKVKNDTLRITPSSSLGVFSRAHKPNVNDNQDVICGLFDEDEQLVCTFTIINDDNYQKFKEDKKNELLAKHADKKNVHDAAIIRYTDLGNYNMNYTFDKCIDDVNIEFVESPRTKQNNKAK